MATITSGFLDHPVFALVSEVAGKTGVRAFVIGGYVRDCFLGRRNDDIDIVVEGSGIALAEAVAAHVKETEHHNCHVSVFRNFGTAMLRYHGTEVEFVGARKESYQRDSRKPIVEDGTLQDDQTRRDFTINAMAFSLQAEDFGAWSIRLAASVTWRPASSVPRWTRTSLTATIPSECSGPSDSPPSSARRR